MLDLYIIGVFLFITLIIGVLQGKGVKSLKSFSLGNKDYSTLILIATITATAINGGDILGGAEKTFIHGISFVFLIILSVVLSNLLIAQLIGTKIEKFEGCLSIGDMIGKYWGEKAKVLSGVTGALMYITGLGAQVSSIGYVFHYFLNIPHIYGAILGCSIVMIYSASGGIKAVTITDVLQFIVLILAVPMISNVGLYKIGGYDKLYKLLPSSSLQILPNNTKDLITNFNFFLILLISLIGPATAQRLLMAQDNLQAKKAFRIAAGIYIVFFMLVGVIGLTAKALAPQLDPVLASPYMIQLLPTGLKGFAIAGVLAIVMSTADSFLNAASILLVNDVVSPMLKYEISDKLKLTIVRYCTVLIGILSLVSALSLKSVFEIIVFSYLFWTPIIIVPFMTSVLGFAIHRKSFWSGAFGAVITIVLWEVLHLESKIYLSSTVPATIMNLIFFTVYHYYYKLFRTEEFDPIISIDENSERFFSKTFDENLKNLLNFYKRILSQTFKNFSAKRVLNFGAQYHVFAVFMVMNYIIPIFMWSVDTPYFLTLENLRLISSLLCIGLLFSTKLSQKFSKYFALYWHFTLMVSLPLTASMMTILNNGEIYWLFNMTLSIFLLASLVDWLSFVLIFLFGTTVGYTTIKLFYPLHVLNPSKENIILAVYMFGFSILIGLLFSRPREDFVKHKLQTLKALGGSIAHELRTPIAALSIRGIGSANYNQKLLEIYEIARQYKLPIPEFTPKEIKNISDYHQDIKALSNESMFLIEMLLTKLKDPSQETSKSYYSIREIIKEALSIYPFYDDQKSLLHVNLEDDFKIYGNKTLILHVIFNLLKNSLYFIQNMNKGEVFIKITVTEEENILTFKDTGKGIPGNKLDKVFEKFYTNNSEGTGLGLAFCKMTIEDLGGKITCNSIYGKFTEFIIKFPQI